jgi:hypothetical protein
MGDKIISDHLVKYILRHTTDTKNLRDVFRALGLDVDAVRNDRVLAVREMIGYTEDDLIHEMTAHLTEASFTEHEEVNTNGAIEAGHRRVTMFREGELISLDFLVKAHDAILDNFKSLTDVVLHFSEGKKTCTADIFRTGFDEKYSIRCTYVFIDDPNLPDTPEPPKKMAKNDHYDTE